MYRLLLIILFAPFYISGQTLSVSTLGLQPPATPACTDVKNQAMSGTCWSFTSTSFIESELLRQGHAASDFSEMFIARHSYIRKVYRHLETKGATYFTPGGQFHDVIWVIRNYGMMPESAYPGKTGAMHDHGELDTLMKYFVAGLVEQKKLKPTTADLDTINGWLDKYLGKLPTDFIYNNKKYTAKSYAAATGLRPDDYVEITSYMHQPFYKPVVLEDKFNWTGDAYYNVPAGDLLAITNHALANGYTVGWDGDVTEPGFLFYKGLAYLPAPVKDYTAERQKTFADKTTEIDHLMHITGVTKDKNGKTWYYVKNSWGTANISRGYMYMQEDYFAVKTVAIIVHKNAIPDTIRGKLHL